MNYKQPTVATRLRCRECETVQEIQRKIGHQKKIGHIKHLWCFNCKKTTSHEEMK